MDRPDDQSALDRAVARGWIDPVDAERWRGEPLERLVQRGLLRAEELDELVADPATRLAAEGRYRIERKIGAGGSGVVYLARDAELDRPVALKILHASDRAALRGALSEARLQARVAHPGICQVYDVGEIAGRAYIAMQHIDGASLGEVLDEMTTDETVAVIRDVARSAGAAHAVGLIHRDLKPANIVVERDDDGGWRPFIVDFGVARLLRDSDGTLTATMVGTPAYMAPEQLGAEVRRIDRRTDVYGIGATLYEALTGSPPFEGDTARVLAEIRDRDPLPPRRRVRSVPVDLETIALVCLEKNPERRYASAAALADDLDRYLRDEPIAARRPGLLRRARKVIARHRAVTVLAALLIATLALATLWGISERREARRRAELARWFAREAATIDARLRLAYLAPLHDTRGARQTVRTRMERIAGKMEGLDPADRASGDLALGAGHFALGEIDPAREALERAWDHGERSAETALLLGRVLAAVHQREVAAIRADAREDEGERRTRIEALDRELAAPARGFLGRATNAWDAGPDIAEGLMKLESGDFDGAIASARAAAERSAWLYQAQVLEARAHLRQGASLEASGDLPGARAALEQAVAVFAGAARVARSDPDVHAEACTAGRWLLDIRILQLAERPSDDEMTSAIAPCDRAMVANPDGTAVLAEKANLLLLQARIARSRGEDPRSLYRAAAEAGQRAAADASADAQTLAVIGEAHARHASDEARYGADPVSSWEAAITAYQRVLERYPDAAVAHTGLAIVFRGRADYALRKTGEDPIGWLDQAIDHGERAAALRPEDPDTWNNLCRIYTLRGNVELARGGDALIWADRAEAAIGRGLELDPDDGPPLNNHGNAVYIRGEAALAAGKDPRPDLERARELYERVLLVIPDYAYGHGNIGGVHLLAAGYELAAGLDPGASIAAAIAAFEQALKLHPGYGRAQSGIAGAHLIAARHALSRRRDPGPALARARHALAEARRIGGGTRMPQRDADLALVEATWAHRQRRDAGAILERAESALDAAIDTTAPSALLVALADIRLRRAHWARGGDAAIAGGLDATATALERNPRDADALAVKAALLRLRDDPEATALLERARGINPLVDPRQLQ